MKYLFLILVLMCGLNFAQQIEDVVYLKNGKIIWGVIIEQVPNKYIKIKSGKNVHVFQMGEIEKITKELSSTSIDISDKTWSVQAGLGTHRSFNLIAISKDFRIRKNGSFF